MNSTQSQEAARILENLSSMAGFNTTTDKATARAVIEHQWIFCHGEIRDIRTKHLGVGVYKIFSEGRP